MVDPVAAAPVARLAGRVPEPELVPEVRTVSLVKKAGSEISALAEPARWAFVAAAALAREWHV